MARYPPNMSVPSAWLSISSSQKQKRVPLFPWQRLAEGLQIKRNLLHGHCATTMLLIFYFFPQLWNMCTCCQKCRENFPLRLFLSSRLLVSILFELYFGYSCSSRTDKGYAKYSRVRDLALRRKCFYSYLMPPFTPSILPPHSECLRLLMLGWF